MPCQTAIDKVAYCFIAICACSSYCKCQSSVDIFAKIQNKDLICRPNHFCRSVSLLTTTGLLIYLLVFNRVQLFPVCEGRWRMFITCERLEIVVQLAPLYFVADERTHNSALILHHVDVGIIS